VINKFLSVLPIIFIVVIFAIRTVNFELYRVLVSEDHLLETFQFLAYFATGCVVAWLACKTVWQDKKKFLSRSESLFTSARLKIYMVLAVAGILFFLSFEEISWGQRILNFRNPYYFAINNVQSEVSIHNLSYIQKFLHWGYVLFGIVLSVASQRPQFFRSRKVPLQLIGFFLPLSIMYLLLELVPPVSLTGPSVIGLVWRDQEVVETLLAVGIFLGLRILVTNTLRVSTKKA
jgi:hypothetical protein